MIYYYPQARETSTKAVLSMVFGILSWLVLPVIGSVVAIVMGSSARKDTKPGRMSGDGMAVAGLILGWANVALWILLIILAIIVPVVLKNAHAGG